MRVVAVVVTFNRKDLLLDCVAGLADQTHPLERVIVVDNASTDGTVEALEGSGLGERVTLDLVRLERNGGGSEGFHYGGVEALRGESDWVWYMDDDCQPQPDCLERLLASKGAADPATAGLAPKVLEPAGRLLPLHRGHIVHRPVRAPLNGPSPEEYERPETDVTFFSFVGPMVRTEVVRRIGVPPREMFIRFEDLEYSARIGKEGRMVLVNDAVIVHKEEVPLLGLGPRDMLENFMRPGEFKHLWKGVYGLRNIIDGGRRNGYVDGFAALTYALLAVSRSLVFDERRFRAAYLFALYAYDGWRGVFRNVPPPKWAPLAEQGGPRAMRAYLNREGLRYDREVAPPARRLTTRPGPPARATPAA
jgi:GT2 family glycosyltransferase